MVLPVFNKYLSHLFFLAFLFIIIGSSCIPNKKIVYFNNSEFNTQEFTPIENESFGSYKLQPQDILSIRVKTLDAESSNYFNVETGSVLNISPATMYLNGYSIDHKGEIVLPEVEPIKVAGLTVSEAHEKINEAIGYYLNNATILVKLVSFKITVLGEVYNPGTVHIFNDKATILEVLGMAGDLTDFGNRENITLIRQKSDGMKAILINLNDPALLSSEHFYLQPNDVLYVQPFKAKSARNNLKSLGIISLVLSLVSTMILISNNVK